MLSRGLCSLTLVVAFVVINMPAEASHQPKTAMEGFSVDGNDAFRALQQERGWTGNGLWWWNAVGIPNGVFRDTTIELRNTDIYIVFTRSIFDNVTVVLDNATHVWFQDIDMTLSEPVRATSSDDLWFRDGHILASGDGIVLHDVGAVYLDSMSFEGTDTGAGKDAGTDTGAGKDAGKGTRAGADTDDRADVAVRAEGQGLLDVRETTFSGDWTSAVYVADATDIRITSLSFDMAGPVAVQIEGGRHVEVRDTEWSGFEEVGLHIESVTYAHLEANRFTTSAYGAQITMAFGGALTMHANDLVDNGVAVRVEGGAVTADRNRFEGNDVGLVVRAAEGGTVYDNVFDNDVDACGDGNDAMAWNTSRRAGPNILGGAWLGGNHWTRYSGVDRDSDHLGDVPQPIRPGAEVTWLDGRAHCGTGPDAQGQSGATVEADRAPLLANRVQVLGHGI